MMFDVVDFTKRWWGKLWEWEIEDEEYYKNERNKYYDKHNKLIKQ